MDWRDYRLDTKDIYLIHDFAHNDINVDCASNSVTRKASNGRNILEQLACL